MIMSDGNKRYLGDVWIDQEKLERQREFFRDIMESYQYKNGGDFDASTLRGFTPSDFATSAQGALAENALHEPLTIGKHDILDITDPQYVYTDGVLLDKCDDEEDIDSTLKTNPWFGDLINQNLTKALLRIYQKTIEIKTSLTEAIDQKLDESEFNDFVQGDFKKVSDIVSGTSLEFIDTKTKTTKRGLNSDLVNGLRPILITKEGYNALLNSKDENERAMATYWRNIFIFVEEVPGDYNMPWEYSLTDPYSFRVSDGYLQVKNNLSEDWVNMSTVDAFLEGANFDETIKEYIEESNDFVIGTTSLQQSLKLIQATDIDQNWEDYPFLSSNLHNDFIHKLQIDGKNHYVVSSEDPNDFKITNIDMTQILKDNQVLTSTGAKRINALNNQLGQHQSDLSAAKTNITNLQTSVSSLNRSNVTQDRRISEISSQLTQLQNSINAVAANVNNLANSFAWKQTYVFTGDGKSQLKSQTAIWYNEGMRVCCVYIDGIYYNHNGKNANKWEDCDMLVPYPLRPKVQYHGSTSYFNMKAKINTNGVIQLNSSNTKDDVPGIWFEAFYNY